ncbi:hypothetical protein BJ875DRAFT_376925 [Amylocarpus encephaloides]|uniref:RING-CH-type domain-containing protein n=1 Tax=Amylocarpus encephaloides TaxID=45428 RepID=A0A9P7YIG1_9HELO|nr:hypothetical protein BJ875DRAFT_376925 [Amylocarpus encephaloides]
MAGTSSNSLLEEVLVNDPSASGQLLASPTSQSTASCRPQEENRRCWICQMDENDDAPEKPLWRRPCPCSLTAHNECLLEWIADAETPKPGGQAVLPSKIVCPVCKAPFKIDRPQDLIVNLLDRTQSMVRRLVLPTAISSLLGCGYAGLFVYGVNTLYLVFGQEEASRILVSMRTVDDSAIGAYLSRRSLTALWSLMTGTDAFFPRMDSSGPFSHWKQWLTLPLIGPALILSRSRMADYVFPLLIPVYFFNPLHRDIYRWPPTAGLTFATLPYIRTAYIEFYRYAFAAVEKKWDLAVMRKPREGETAEGIAQQAEDEDIFEIQIVEGDVGGDNELPNENQAPGPLQVNPQANAQGEDAPLGNAQADGVVGEQPGAVGPPHRRDDFFFQRNWSIAQAAIKITGALSLPLVSSVMGDLLEVLLPARWVGKGAFGGRYSTRGLLGQKWGRTVAGGCLFVVLKDVITLYAKWKRAKNFGKRTIIDYDGLRRGR